MYDFQCQGELVKMEDERMEARMNRHGNINA
jgi:hypothetical protein